MSAATERGERAIVIGAGVIGSSVALELARGGRDVLVIDKGPGAGAGSTSSSSLTTRPGNAWTQIRTRRQPTRAPTA